MFKIRKYGDPVLRQKAEPVKEINANVLKLIENMLELMYSAHGVGLAANQVGVLKQVVVINISGPEVKKNAIVLINPKIIKSEGEMTGEEGCLSFVPEMRYPIRRKAKISVKYLDVHGKEKKISAADLLSRVMQHEIDHLHGILFIDHMESSSKSTYLKKLREKEYQDSKR